VIDKLAGFEQFRTISREAVFRMVDPEMSFEQVADMFQVQYLLNGELCRDGVDLVMRAELTGRDHLLVWNGRFRQSVNRFDQVEQQLARQVAEGIAVELAEVAGFDFVVPIMIAPNEPINAVALEKLRIGQHQRLQGNHDQARQAFEEALEREPEYAEALFELALVTNDLAEDSIMGGIRKARPIAEKALAVARDAIKSGTTDYKAHWVTAKILLELSQWERALTWRTASALTAQQVEENKASALSLMQRAEQHLRAAIQLNPSEPELYQHLWFVVDEQGPDRQDESLEILQQTRITQPFDEYLIPKLARSLANRGQYHRAMEELERFEVLGEVPSRIRWHQMEIQQEASAFDDRLELLVEMLQFETEKFSKPGIFSHLYWSASSMVDLGLDDEAEALYQTLAAVPVPREPESWAWFRQLFLEDMYRNATGRREEVARERLAEVEGLSNEQILDQWYLEAERIGLSFWDAGETERAIEIYEALSHVAVKGMAGSAKAHLVMFYTYLGRAEDAAPLLEETIALVEEAFYAGSRNPSLLEGLATFYAFKGEDDKALDMMKKSVDFGAWYWAGVRNPEFDRRHDAFDQLAVERLKNDPRYQRQKQRAQALAKQKADNIRHLLATHDIDALLIPVIEMQEAAIAAKQKDS
jgi:tetratricopeptide (TPR) repeat protein